MKTNSQFAELSDEELIQYAVECIGHNGSVPAEAVDRLKELGVWNLLEEVRPSVS